MTWLRGRAPRVTTRGAYHAITRHNTSSYVSPPSEDARLVVFGTGASWIDDPADGTRRLEGRYTLGECNAMCSNAMSLS